MICTIIERAEGGISGSSFQDLCQSHTIKLSSVGPCHDQEAAESGSCFHNGWHQNQATSATSKLLKIKPPAKPGGSLASGMLQPWRPALEPYILFTICIRLYSHIIQFQVRFPQSAYAWPSTHNLNLEP